MYEFNGKIHKWIMDQYIVPFNLCIDIKDGGNNPNNRNMEEYRNKQIAKEKAIREQKEFNYLRLTNNDFGQLLAAMLKIKDNIAEGNNSKLWAINEYMGGCSANKVCSNRVSTIIPLMIQNTFIEPAYSTDRFLNNIYEICTIIFIDNLLDHKLNISRQFNVYSL